jgi:hypothetical protein
VSKKTAIALCAGAALLVTGLPFGVRYLTQRPASIQGAVITRDTDPARELPVADVEITLLDVPTDRKIKSGASGYFAVPLPWRIRPNQPINLRLSHPGYQTMDLQITGGNVLYIARLTPTLRPSSPNPASTVKIANVVVDYSMTTTTTINIGSAVKTFEVTNEGSVPCQGHRPCSPDGKWKASEGTAAIDAGAGNQFQNARVSCIAGPCPFTRIDGSNLKSGSRTLQVAVLGWAGTSTFLLEAEVYKPLLGHALRHSYPLVFDRSLTFTLPPTADGVSIEAEVNGTTIVFPLGPALYLSWANCQVAVNQDQTKVYRCELNPGYRFDDGRDKRELN